MSPPSEPDPFAPRRPRFALRTVYEVADVLIEVEFVLDSGRHRTTQRMYVDPATIASFGRGLMDFPRSPDHEVEFDATLHPPEELGLRVFMVSASGASAIEVRYDNGAYPPEHAAGVLHFPCYPATINELGKRLVQWSRTPQEDMSFDWVD